MNSVLYITVLLPLLVAICSLVAAEDSKCESCRSLTRGILDGLDKTKKKNFEGGDVAWEEKKLGKYKTSETRLVEILESYACKKENHKCNSILEEKEDIIYNWYNKLQDEIPLFDYLCVNEAKFCCPDGTFGAECEECPKGDSDKICFGRGKCEGDGDRQGSGKCVCDEGYAGDLCNECGDRHFETFSNETYIMCSLCHKSCKTCKGNKSSECITCLEGYRSEENIDDESEMKCTDINECVEQSNLCPVGTYCLNNEGSYSCEDIDECASGAICLGMYEVCVNTLGHYRCECARYFRRDQISGQCQPDPNIYSRMGPLSRVSSTGAPEQPKDDKMEGEKVEKSDVEEGLSDDDIKRLAVAVVICIIGTAAASGDLIWTALFFCSVLCAGIWWASDKTDRLLHHMANKHQEL